MWTLVLISIMLNGSSGKMEPVIDGWYEFDTMYECFYARQSLGVATTGIPGTFPVGKNAICIPHFPGPDKKEG